MGLLTVHVIYITFHRPSQVASCGVTDIGWVDPRELQSYAAEAEDENQ